MAIDQLDTLLFFFVFVPSLPEYKLTFSIEKNDTIGQPLLEITTDI